MNAKDVIRQAMNSNLAILRMYLDDLSDADQLVGPVPGANHAAWQLGHLIASEVQLLDLISGAKSAALPAGFAEKHTKEAAGNDSAAAFLTKGQYVEQLERIRAATLDALDKYPEADLDKPMTGNWAKMIPNMGALFLLVANHVLLHAGQLVTLRRRLGEPVQF